MANKLSYQSTFNDVGWSLRQTLDEIKQHGETKQLKFEMLIKYGRVLLMEGKLNEAYQVFQQCSHHAIDNGIEVKELYYWTSKCLECLYCILAQQRSTFQELRMMLSTLAIAIFITFLYNPMCKKHPQSSLNFKLHASYLLPQKLYRYGTGR